MQANHATGLGRFSRGWIGAGLVAAGIGAGLLLQPAVVAKAKDNPARVATARGPLPPEERAVVDLFKKAAPSVVFINTTQRVRTNPFSMRATQDVPLGAGSGFVWDTEGHVITNFHVINGASRANVTLADGTTWDASLVDFAPDADIAVLKIDAPADKLSPITIGTSEDLEVGQRVYAIGNPFGLDRTLTTGIVSALGRSIDSIAGNEIAGVIQTDAAINPGNSGGPLLDSAGRLIGMNTAIRSSSGGSNGVGFAVPVESIVESASYLMSTDKRPKVVIGITSVDGRIASQLGVHRGVLIEQITPESGAEKAGLRETRQKRNGEIILGDVITEIDNKPIRSMFDLRRALRAYKPGDEVEVAFLRDEQTQKAKIVLSPAEQRD